jgi:hypothetical protein
VVRAPRQPHPWPHARYEVHRPADRAGRLRPHALRVLGLLRATLQLAVPGITLAGAWAPRRWRGLLCRVRDVFRAAAALVSLGYWLHRIPT